MGSDAKRLMKVLALLRVSTKEQDMERQRADIQWHIERFAEQGIDLEIEKVYALDGITGMVVQNTPEFKAMLNHLKQPQISGIILSQLDRFMRPEHADAYGALKIFRTGKKLMFCDAKNALDITNPEDRTVIINQLEAAFMERRKIQYRTQRKKEELIKDPTISVTKLPKGVKHVKDFKLYGAKTKKGHFEYTPWAHEHVKPAFERAAAGESLSSIAAALEFSNESWLRQTLQNKWWLGINERTHMRPVEYDEETGRKIVGKRIQHHTPYIHRTNLADNPLVTSELFDRVQTILAVNKSHWTQVQSNTGQFLGTGLLFCECGEPLYLKYDARRGKPPVYVCSSYQKRWRARKFKGENLPVCKASRMRAEEVDIAIWVAAIRYLAQHDVIRKAIVKAQKTDEARTRQVDLESAVKLVEELEAKKRRAQKLFAIDGDEDAERLLHQIMRDLAEAKIRLATAKAQAQPFGSNDAVQIAESIANRFIGQHTWTMEKKRAELSAVVERITIDSRNFAHFVVRGGLPLQQSHRIGEVPKPFDVNTLEGAKSESLSS